MDKDVVLKYYVGKITEDLEKSRVLKRKVSWNLISINPVFTFLLFYLIIKLCKLKARANGILTDGICP